MAVFTRQCWSNLMFSAPKIVVFIVTSVMIAFSQAQSLSVGQPVGDMEAVYLDGSALKFDRIPNQVTVFMLGAGWCPPCGPLKDKMAGSFGETAFKKNPSVRFIYLQVDDKYLPEAKTPVDFNQYFHPAKVDHSKFGGKAVHPSNPKFWSQGAWYSSNLPNLMVIDSRGILRARGKGSELNALTDFAMQLTAK
jgi:thiol-disulfide isomerase/thioredoxin